MKPNKTMRALGFSGGEMAWRGEQDWWKGIR